MFARDWTILPHNVTKLPFSAKLSCFQNRRYVCQLQSTEVLENSSYNDLRLEYQMKLEFCKTAMFNNFSKPFISISNLTKKGVSLGI